MSRWFRLYDDTLNDPKILKLSDKTYRIWIGILCVASKNDGALPPFDDIALMLRMKPEKLQPELEKLIAAGLIDHDDDGLRPHNWEGRQYKSDVSTDRVKRFRSGKRNVSVTPPDTEQNTDTEAEKKKEPELRSDALTLVKVSRETKSTGKHLLPDDWQPKPDHYALAREKNITEAGVTDAVREMRSWSKGNGEKRTNWDFVFNNWLTRNAKNGQRGPRPLQDDSKSISAAAGRLAEAAQRGEFTFGPRPSLLPDPNETPVFLLSKG